MVTNSGDLAAKVPFPGEWEGAPPSVSRPLVASCVVVGGFAALATVAFVSEGHLSGAVLATLLTLLFLAFVVVGVRARRWPGRRVPSVEITEHGGLRFPYSRLSWHVTVGMLLGSVPFLGVIVWVVATDADPSRRQQVIAVLAPILIILTVVHARDLATGRIRRGEVVLAAEGVTHRTWGARFHLGWTDVAYAVAEGPSSTRQVPGIRLGVRPGQSASYERCAVVFGSPAHRDLPDLVVRADLVEGDAALLAHAVVFYALHPQHRAELGDGRALGRVLDGRAVVPQVSRGGRA